MSFTIEDVIKDHKLSEKQVEALKEFREIVGDILQAKHDDYYLLCFLKAREFDLPKSEEMFRKSMQWRKQNKVDTILQDYKVPAVLKKYYPGGHLAFDKDGCPIWMIEPAQFDLKGITMSIKRDELKKFFIYIMEYVSNICKEQTKKTGRKISQMTVLNNMSGFSLATIMQPGWDQMMQLFPMVEANYPEIMKVNFIINAPRVFPVVYNMLKTFMHENTRKKMRVHGGTYLDDLLEVIGSESIPQCFGGTMVDENGDPRCSAIIPLGGSVPESYFLKPEDIIGDKEATTAVVSKGSHFDVPFEVKEGENKMLKWVFWTIHYDIQYTVLYQQNAAQLFCQTVKNMERINAQVVPVDGFLKCNKPGLYTFRFDNTYSWVRGKEVHYVINLVDIDQTKDDEIEMELTEDGVDGE